MLIWSFLFRNPSFRCYVTPLLIELYLLPVKFRIDYKIIVISFKAIDGLVPKYLTELVFVKAKSKPLSLMLES